MKNLNYQQKAVNSLVEKTIELLSLSGNRRTLVFKAPTGSGKTVMASEMLLRLNTELRERPDSPYTEAAFIWIAPNKLHEQSYFKIKSYFTETNELKPVVYDEMDTSASGYIKSGEILFVNWESINKDNALMIRDTEQSASLYDITRRTQEEQNIPIIVIIDEEHMFAGKQAKKSDMVLQNINPKLEIRISATPITANPDDHVTVHRERVIAEQMIKEGVVLNPALAFNESLGSLNQHLVNLALTKREELADAYRKLGVKINPLLLIQLPNDGSEAMNADDISIRDEVVEYLDTVQGINTKNGKLGIWLSGEKTNLEDIDEHDNLTEVLLFKQAIALGWDCPRAAILLIFRKIESFTFTAQTVGRILRMPEQKFYSDDRLNKGYVYTNLSKDIIEIVKDDMDYLSSYHCIRRKDLNNITLTSEFCERPATDRKRLGVDFKKHMSQIFEERLLVKNSDPIPFNIEDLETCEPADTESVDRSSLHEKNRKEVAGKINFNVSCIGIDIVEDLDITGEVGKTMIKNKARYVRTIQELNHTYIAFCSKLIGSKFEKVSITTLGHALKELMVELFGLSELEAIKVVLAQKNKEKFEDLITIALDSYLRILVSKQKAKAEKSYIKYEWEVPADRLYKEDTHHINDGVKNHALMPYVELNTVSSAERKFTDFLESNMKYIDWWYKNGDGGKNHYAISYINKDGDKSLFYVDFIIRMKNGEVFLFDTKTKASDDNAPHKHNALIDYINSENKTGKNLKGGIIIENGSNWKYCPQKIENTTDIISWESFYPDEISSTSAIKSE